MILKNKTSSVHYASTISRIEMLLAEFGATGITKDYTDGTPSALCFHINTPDRGEITVRLPSDSKAVYQRLITAVRRPRSGTDARIRQQAERTAWKIAQDWLEVQLTLVRLQKVDVLQVFLAYVWNGRQTFYDALKSGGFKLLPGPKGSDA